MTISASSPKPYLYGRLWKINPYYFINIGKITIITTDFIPVIYTVEELKRIGNYQYTSSWQYILDNYSTIDDTMSTTGSVIKGVQRVECYNFVVNYEGGQEYNFLVSKGSLEASVNQADIEEWLAYYLGFIGSAMDRRINLTTGV